MDMTMTTLSKMNYDPNLTSGMKHVEYTVKITLSQWHYIQSYQVTVITNTRGLDVIRYAVEVLYDSLPAKAIYDTDNDCYVHIAEVHIGELLCSDDAWEGAIWLHEMVVGAEIISIKSMEDK